MDHAKLAAQFARRAFEGRRQGIVTVQNRVVIPNDTKLMAQAQIEGVDIFISRDDNCERVSQFLRSEGLITFTYLDLRTPPNEFFGVLFQ